MHLNARSLLKNLDQLNLSKSHSLFLACQKPADSASELVNITGYNFVSNHRKSKIGGRVNIYLQNDIEYKILKECKFTDPEVIESLSKSLSSKGKTLSSVVFTDHQIKTLPCF